jgi:CheY-like chemotaxis protein
MHSSPSCVLVDDDPDFMHFVRLWLSRLCPGLEVVEFSSSLEAWGYLRQHHTDLLITDFRMPFLDGLGLTARIRKTDPEVPIIVMSGDEVASAALATGANAFVPKRSLAKDLLTVIRRLGFPVGA